MSAAVRAAGGVIWRPGPDGGVPDSGGEPGSVGAVEVLVVHRPRYDDWTFPKGKRDPGETDEACARREVREETGLEVELGTELPPSSYVDAKGRDKVVRYWTMTVTGGAFTPNDEVDEVRWVSLASAARLLSYPRDQPVLVAAAAVLSDRTP